MLAKNTNIAEEHKEAFDALVSGKYDNFILMSCFVDGKPACVICVVDDDVEGYEEDECRITPLFVSVMDDMIISDHEGNVAKPELVQ